MPNLTFEDAELLTAAHLDLLTALTEGVTVLGRSDCADLLHIAHTMQGQDASTVMTLPGFVTTPAATGNEVAA